MFIRHSLAFTISIFSEWVFAFYKTNDRFSILFDHNYMTRNLQTISYDRNIASGSLFFHFQPVVFLIVLCYISFWTNNLSAWAEHDGDRFKSSLIAFLVCISVAKFTVAVWNPKISMKQVKRKMKSYLKYFTVSYVQDFGQIPNSS